MSEDRASILRTEAKKAFSLTEQECVVIMWLSKGKRYEEIGILLEGLSYSAIKQCVHRIMNKMGASTTAGVVGIAFRRKIIT